MIMTHLIKHMQWRQRTVSEVLATRTAKRGKVSSKRNSRARGDQEGLSLRKGELGSQERVQAVKYLERKCRISFGEGFGVENFEWKVALGENQIVLEQGFDPEKRSYYVFAGKMTIFQHKNTHITENTEQTITIEAEKGIGWIFGQQQSYSGCKIVLHSGTALKISHSHSQMGHVQRNCLMTIRQKQQAIGKFKLFSSIQNLTKTHLPHFIARRYVKGENVYLIGEQAKQIFLVIQGEVAFESPLPHAGNASPLKKALLRRESTVVRTETISKNTYFGEEEVLAQITRKQNAKCASIDCLLLIVPGGRVEKLLSVPQFKKSLQYSAILKQQARQHQISSVLALSQSREQPSLPSPQDETKFTQLKTAIYTHLYSSKEERPFRSKIGKDRKKVIHNHSLSLPQGLASDVRVEDFSMLTVNKSMYHKTLMRFRYHLKEIQKSAQGRPIPEVVRGRSLQDIWRTLKLEKSFNPEQEHLPINDEEGITYYNAHQRIARQIKESKGFRPKTLHCNSKIRSEYLQYLQSAL